MRPASLVRAVVGLLAAVLLLAGCTGSGDAGGSPAAEGPLADVVLPCLAGGQQVRLGALGRPTVINLWASWCAPCREELPTFQRYAARSAGAVLVLGVATEDTLPAARSLVDDLGLTFPMLYDRDAAVRNASGKLAGLPVTIFLDANGVMVYSYNGRALDDATLAGLVERHLGVRR